MTTRSPRRPVAASRPAAIGRKHAAPSPPPAPAPAPAPRGRPRKYSADAATSTARYAEAQRLEVERDRLAAEAEHSPTMASKGAVLRVEMLLAQAWAAAMRADGKIPAAIKFSELAVKHAAAHAKAVEQLFADRIDELHRLVVQRQDAARALGEELGGEA